jgi:hypothetical protein
MSQPSAIIRALETERERYKSDKEHVRLIDIELDYYKARPVPAEVTTDQGVLVADRTEAYLAALRVEKARYPNRAKEIDVEIKRTEADKHKGVERTVEHTRGVQRAVEDHDLPE